MKDILGVVIILLACYGLALFAYNRLSKKANAGVCSHDRSSAIMKMIYSNNNYPPMLDVFTSLSEDLESNGMELHADLKGYLDYGKEK